MVQFIYDDSLSSEMGIALIRNIHRDILPPVESRLMRLTGRHGTQYFGYTFAERIITIEVVVTGDTLERLRERVRLLAAWLRPGKEKRLIFSDEEDKYYRAVLSGQTNLDQLVTVGEGTLVFLCPDPFAYAISPDIITL